MRNSNLLNQNFQMRLFVGLGMGLLLLSATSCGQGDEMRRYTETTYESPLVKTDTRQSMADPHPFIAQMEKTTGKGVPGSGTPVEAPVPLTWVTPKGWTEKPGDGIRMATFVAETPDDGIECSIVSLVGTAGGIKANVIRWMGQLEVPVPPPEKLAEFLERQPRLTSEGGFAGVLIDLSELQIRGDQAAGSMMAAMITAGGSTVFVKMTGSLAGVRGNRDQFFNLCRSLRKNE